MYYSKHEIDDFRNRCYPGWWMPFIASPVELPTSNFARFYRVVCHSSRELDLAKVAKPPLVRAQIDYEPRNFVIPTGQAANAETWRSIKSTYLGGLMPRQKFVEACGSPALVSLWEDLAEEMEDIVIRSLQEGVSTPPSVEESDLFEAMTTANSFLLWNLPHGFAAGPTDRASTLPNGSIIFPIVLTSPGIGIVGEVGKIAISVEKQVVVGCTPQREIKLHGMQLHEQHKQEIETAFLQARDA